MDIVPLAPNEAAVRRYVEELWLPYHRDLAAAVDAHALSEDVDLVEEELGFRMERLEAEDYALGVAVAGGPDVASPAEIDLADVEGDLVGFVATSVDESPSVFDRSKRLIVGDIYVREAHRGTGLAEDLMAWAAERARAANCEQLALDVDVDNERALRFYEKLGFEPYRHKLAVDVDDM